VYRPDFLLLFNIEPHALSERKLRPEIDRVGGATHICLPCVGAGLATAARLLFATKGTTYLGSRRPNVYTRCERSPYGEVMD
jgi:hypothetical protein